MTPERLAELRARYEKARRSDYERYSDPQACVDQLLTGLALVPELFDEVERLQADVKRFAVDAADQQTERLAAWAEVDRMRAHRDRAADLIGDLVRADNTRLGAGPDGRITAADTLPLQQHFDLHLTIADVLYSTDRDLGEHELLTHDEHRAIEIAGQLWGRLCAIVGQGSSREGDLTELVHHIHAIQHAVMSQAAARAYPDLYRLLGETIPRPVKPIGAPIQHPGDPP